MSRVADKEVLLRRSEVNRDIGAAVMYSIPQKTVSRGHFRTNQSLA